MSKRSSVFGSILLGPQLAAKANEYFEAGSFTSTMLVTVDPANAGTLQSPQDGFQWEGKYYDGNIFANVQDPSYITHGELGGTTAQRYFRDHGYVINSDEDYSIPEAIYFCISDLVDRYPEFPRLSVSVNPEAGGSVSLVTISDRLWARVVPGKYKVLGSFGAYMYSILIDFATDVPVTVTINAIER